MPRREDDQGRSGLEADRVGGPALAHSKPADERSWKAMRAQIFAEPGGKA